MPIPITTVLEPSNSIDLTTLEIAKEELNVKDAKQDKKIARWITEESELITSRVGMTLGLEKIKAVFEVNTTTRSEFDLILPRYPVIDIETVTETSIAGDDVVLTTGQFGFNADSGLIWRYSDGFIDKTWWIGRRVTVIMHAGWLLPDYPPASLRKAVLSQLKHRMAVGTRDPTLKTETVGNLITAEYWVGTVGEDGALTPEAASLIRDFRELRI